MMTRPMALLAGILLLATCAWAATNLNSSKSNAYRLTYSTDAVSREQARAMLAELDRMGTVDEARLKQWLAANFKRFGIQGERIRKIVVLPRNNDLKEVSLLLLGNPADEPAAIAVTVKSSKSNSSE